MFDMNAHPSTQQSCEAGHTFEPTYPGTAKGIGAEFIVRGPHSEAVRRHSQEAIDLARERAMVARRGQPQGEATTVGQFEQQLTEAAVAYTIGWRGVSEGGQPVQFTPEAARSLYQRHPWLRDQVLEQGRDLGNFVKPCSTSSTSTPEPNTAST